MIELPLKWFSRFLVRRKQKESPTPRLSLSFSASRFVEGLNLEGARVFEYGTGESTLFWQQQMQKGLRSYSGVESSLSTFVEFNVANSFYSQNVRGEFLIGVESAMEYLDLPYRLATLNTSDDSFLVPFDLFFINGKRHSHWFLEAELASAHKSTCTEGFIFVDNADLFKNTVIDFQLRHNLFRVDFADMENGQLHVTSLLFRNPARMFDVAFPKI